ncbi:hypothetical protein M2351_007201 [Azospirillum canadense]|nr:hypothetical protein [Azospirillum canadense]MCW2242545.1 hypothetical protein [Azospirillum canadense]
MLLLVFQRAPLVGDLLAPLGQLLQADHRRLIGIKQALVGAGKPAKAPGDPLLGPLLLGCMVVGLVSKLLELGHQLIGRFEQAADMLPDRAFEIVGVHAGARTGLCTGGFQPVLAGAPVVAAPAGADGAEHGEAAGATRQQAAQKVSVLGVVAERQDRVPPRGV